MRASLLKRKQSSNLDITLTRLVKKGCYIQFPETGVVDQVIKVRMGRFITSASSPYWSASKCCEVRVVGKHQVQDKENE